MNLPCFVTIPCSAEEADDLRGKLIPSHDEVVVSQEESGAWLSAARLWQQGKCHKAVVVKIDDTMNVYLRGIFGKHLSQSVYDLPGNVEECHEQMREISQVARSCFMEHEPVTEDA